MKRKYKTWLTPFVTVTFAAIAITGILMLFHIEVPGLRAIHEWGGIIVFIAVIAHLVLNWNIFTGYLRDKSALFGIVAGVAMMLLVLAVAPRHKDHGEHDVDFQNFGYSHKMSRR